MAETVALTMGELDRLQVMSQLAERRLTRRGAAALLGLSERQVRRLYRAFRRDGATALASRHRGRPSNRQLATATREQALTLVYVDDATSRLMELAFAAVESTFDYFRATRRYLGAPRKADGLLQRSTQRLSCPRPRARSERPWALTIRARPAGAQHRPPLRTQ